MTEQKLQEIKKEKLDDIYVDDKEITKKNKKKIKTKTNKKNKAIDFLDYAKEKGLDINLQYEETKPIEFPKEYNKKNDNNRNYYNDKKNDYKDMKKGTEQKQKQKEKDKENYN